MVVGSDREDSLGFTAIDLTGPRAQSGDVFVLPEASEGETRSHGFFYKPDGKDTGLLGLPIAREGRPGYKHLVEGSAAILFLRNNGLDLGELGEMGAGNLSTNNDGCRASCVDWYGNSRPIFVNNRVFALMGYEIVEGELAANRLAEVRRVSFSPVTVGLAR